MPRNAATQVENNFTRGLITEATGLNFPENACTDTENCVFSETGAVSRRLGFDYEDDYVLSNVTRNASAITEYSWDSVAGTGTLSFCVVQIGDKLNFWQVDEEGALSATKKSFTVDLDTFKVSGAPRVDTEPCSFSDGNGYLFVTHKYCTPFYIAYNVATNSITSTVIPLKIRDFAGVSDGLEIDERPPDPISSTHLYNLYNQGWNQTSYCVDPDGGSGSSIRHVLTRYQRGDDNPSNADVWWLGKRVSTESGREMFDPDTMRSLARGNTPAPKGHYILSAFYEDRSDESNIAGLPVVSSGYYRPVCNAFSNGRVIYAGVNSQGYNNKIFFSRVIENTSHFGQCYQDNDPTAEDFADLLPTDGGVILIPDLGATVKIIPIQGFILVFATNGIWAISGREGVGFAANDYSVRRISSVPAISATSFVINKTGLPVWWNTDGIYTVAVDQVTGTIDVQTLTEKTIKTFFDDIPAQSKYFAKGAFNPLDSTIQWVYRSTSTADTDDLYEYDRVLNLNVITGAFYPWTVTQPNTGPRINGIIVAKGSGTIVSEELVTDSLGATVTTTGGTPVTVDVSNSVPLSSSIRFLTTIPSSGTTYRFTFSLAHNVTMFDWVLFTSADEYLSYAVTGYKVHGEAQKKFQANDIFFYFLDQPSASCYVQGIWDFAEASESGRYTTAQQVISNRSNYSVQRSRKTIRGRGYALQLRFESYGNKPFTLYGWSSFETAAALP